MDISAVPEAPLDASLYRPSSTMEEWVMIDVPTDQVRSAELAVCHKVLRNIISNAILVTSDHDIKHVLIALALNSESNCQLSSLWEPVPISNKYMYM